MKKILAAMLVFFILLTGSGPGLAKPSEKMPSGGNDKYLIPEEDARRMNAEGTPERTQEKDADKKIPEGERKLLERLNRARAMSDTLAQ